MPSANDSGCAIAAIRSARNNHVQRVAQVADRVVAVEILRLILPRFGTTGHQIRARVDVRRGGVDGQERERGFGSAFREQSHAAGDALVETDRHGTGIHRQRLERRLGLSQIGGVFGADDSQLLTERLRESGMRLDPVGQCSRADDSGGERGRLLRVLGLSGRLGGLRGVELRVQIGIRGGDGRGIRRDQSERRGQRGDLRVEVVMPGDQFRVRLGDVVLLGHVIFLPKERCDPHARQTSEVFQTAEVSPARLSQ